MQDFKCSRYYYILKKRKSQYSSINILSDIKCDIYYIITRF